MNIIKIQDQLKGVPDNTLVGYVQNPSGQVPTYLALAELQRRKDMRIKYQANKPEEKTVAEDLVQESQPGIAALPEGQPMQQAMEPPPEMPMEQMAQGGLADLDTGNMYDENNYATGGIVAFDDGGRVKPRATLNPYADEEGQIRAAQYLAGADLGSDRFNVGADIAGMVDKRGFTDPRLQAMYANYVTDEGNRYGARYNPDARQASLERESSRGNIFGIDVAPDYYGVRGEYRFANGGDVKHYAKGDYVYSTDYDPVEQYRRARQLGIENVMSRKYGMPTTSVTKAGIETPYDAALNYYEELRNQAAMSGKGLPELKSSVDALQKRREAWLAGSLDPYSQTSPVGSAPNLVGDQKPVVPAAKPSGQPDVTLGADEAKKQSAAASIGFDPSFYDKMLGKEKTLQELSDEYKAVLGTDPTLAARQERLAKMDARAAKMEEQAPWLALAKAGFEMASARPEYGKGQSAIADIARGAGAGIKDYAEAKDKLASLEEKRFVLDTELSKQQRAEQMAALTYGVNSKQHTEEMNKTIMLAKAKDKLSRDVANLEASVAVTKAGATNALKLKDIAEVRAAYQNSEQQKKDIERIKKEYKLGDNADKESSPRHEEFKKYLRIAEEQYLANYFAPIGSNIPTVSTEGFKIKK
jgi:hypothetical protein